MARKTREEIIENLKMSEGEEGRSGLVEAYLAENPEGKSKKVEEIKAEETKVEKKKIVKKKK